MLLAYQRDVHRMQHATRDPMSIQLYQYSHSKGILLLDTCHSRLISRWCARVIRPDCFNVTLILSEV